MTTNGENAGFESAYQQGDFADYYGEKHDKSATLRFRNRKEQRMWAQLLGEISKPVSILDCPAGAGRFWSLLSRLGQDVTAVDASEEMMASGRKVHVDALPKSCTVAMAQDLPFDDKTFDLVFCSRLLHHFPLAKDRQEILQSFARVSKNYVAFSTWRTGNLKHFQNSRRKEAQSRFFASMSTIHKDVEAAGLKVVGTVHKQRLISPIVAILCVHA